MATAAVRCGMPSRKRLELTGRPARSSSRRRAAKPSSAPGDQGPLIPRASARSARRLPTFRPPSRRPSAPTGWDPLISRRTGWRCCTSLAANGSRPCPSGWSPCTCAASATSPSAGSSGPPTRNVAADHPVPARRDGAATRTHRPVRLVDRAVPPSVGTAGADDAASNMGAMSERGAERGPLIFNQPDRLGCSRAARRASASIARRAFSGLSSISPDRQACT